MSSNTEALIVEWLASQRQAMIDLLRDVVNIDSGSYDKAGVDAVGERFQQHFAEHDIETWREPNDVYGDAVHAVVTKPGSNEKPILLLGHRDTVFPKGEVEKRPFTIKDNKAYGPGVADMKAGVVINVFVAAALNKFEAAPHPIKVLITGDEEIASRASRPIIEREGRAARAVYNSEPAVRLVISSPAARVASSCASRCSARLRIPATTFLSVSALSVNSRIRSCRFTRSPTWTRASR